MNIVLIGYRGSGKSTIGRRLASKLWMEFVDADALITERTGKTIKQIFDELGEVGFRDIETKVIQELGDRDGLVIAPGGGVVQRSENVAALKKNGKIIWLRADPETLLARIQADASTNATRPNLTPMGGGIDEIKAVLSVREPMYRAAADASLEVDRLTVDDAVYRVTTMV